MPPLSVLQNLLLFCTTLHCTALYCFPDLSNSHKLSFSSFFLIFFFIYFLICTLLCYLALSYLIMPYFFKFYLIWFPILLLCPHHSPIVPFALSLPLFVPLPFPSSVLNDPTYGGVSASYAMQADIRIALSDARIGEYRIWEVTMSCPCSCPFHEG